MWLRPSLHGRAEAPPGLYHFGAGGLRQTQRGRPVGGTATPWLSFLVPEPQRKPPQLATVGCDLTLLTANWQDCLCCMSPL